MTAAMDGSKLFQALNSKWLIFAVLGTMFLGALVAAWWVTSPPQAVEGNTGGNRSLTLTWPHPSDGSVAGYQYSTNHGVTWSDVAYSGGSVNFQTDISAPAAGSAIVFLLRAGGAGGTAPVVTPQAGGTGAPVLSAQGVNDEIITLVWTEPTQGPGTPVALYELDWSPDGTGGSWQRLTTLDPASGRSYQDIDLYGVTERWYRVRAADASFNYGPWSAAVSASPLIPKPTTPVLAATALTPGYGIELTWTEPTQARVSNVDIHHYDIEWSSNGSDGSWQSLTEHKGSWPRGYGDVGVAKGETRFYRIRAVDWAEEISPWSAVASATATFWPPESPSLTVTVIGSNSVYLQWYEPFSDNTPILRYELQASSNGGTNFQTLDSNLPASTLEYTHAGLSAGAVREYRLRACSVAGCGEWETSSSVTVGQNAVPAAPVLTAKTINHEIIALRWTPPHDGGSELIEYEIEASDDGTDWDDAETFRAEPDRLGIEYYHPSSGMTKYYRIRAVNDSGEGAWSAVVSATTAPAGVPGMPTNLTVTVAGDTSIHLTWESPNNNTGSITGFRIERADLETHHDIYEHLATVQTYEYSDTGVRAGGAYAYRVAAVNQVGTGEFAVEQRVETTGQAIRGSAPTLAATATVSNPGNIELSWTEPSMEPHGVKEYDIEWSEDGADGSWDYLTHMNADSDRIYDDWVGPGVTRYYRIRAVDSYSAHTPWSNVASATASAYLPEDPFVDAIAVGNDSVYVSWDLGSDGDSPILRQELQVSTDGGKQFQGGEQQPACLGVGLHPLRPPVRNDGGIPSAGLQRSRLQRMGSGAAGHGGFASRPQIAGSDCQSRELCHR